MEPTDTATYLTIALTSDQLLEVRLALAGRMLELRNLIASDAVAEWAEGLRQDLARAAATLKAISQQEL